LEMGRSMAVRKAFMSNRRVLLANLIGWHAACAAVPDDAGEQIQGSFASLHSNGARALPGAAGSIVLFDSPATGRSRHHVARVAPVMFISDPNTVGTRPTVAILPIS